MAHGSVCLLFWHGFYRAFERVSFYRSVIGLRFPPDTTTTTEYILRHNYHNHAGAGCLFRVAHYTRSLYILYISRGEMLSCSLTQSPWVSSRDWSKSLPASRIPGLSSSPRVVS